MNNGTGSNNHLREPVKNYLADFVMDMVAYIQGNIGQIVSVNIS